MGVTAYNYSANRFLKDSGTGACLPIFPNLTRFRVALLTDYRTLATTSPQYAHRRWVPNRNG